MHAQAGIIGRVARERTEKRRKRYPKRLSQGDCESHASQDPLQTPHRFFLPCLRGPSILTVVAVLLMVLGGVLCNFAFHAKTYALVTVSGGNNTTTNETLYRGLQSLSYLGPITIGMGVFLIIVVCVTVFEKRESMIKDVVKRKAALEQQMDCECSYKRALETLKPGDELNDVEANIRDTRSLLRPNEELGERSNQRLNCNHHPHLLRDNQSPFTAFKSASEPTPDLACYSLYNTDSEEQLPSMPKSQSSASIHSLLPSDAELHCISDGKFHSSEHPNQTEISPTGKLYCGCIENKGYEKSNYSLQIDKKLLPLNPVPTLPSGNNQGDQTLQNLAQLGLILHDEKATEL